MKLIIGLGNPGKKYERTRHNLGFLVLDFVAEKMEVEFKEKKSIEAEIAKTPHFTMIKPQTFMNLSGRALQKWMKQHKIKAEDVLVVCDDADLDFGKIRYRKGGSSGGHNGLESIIETFPSGSSVPRLRIGVGRPLHPEMELDEWVLGKWSEKEEEKLPEIIKLACEQIFHIG